MAIFRFVFLSLIGCIWTAAFALPSPAVAGRAKCTVTGEPPAVRLEELRGRIKYSNGHSSKQLTRKFGGRRNLAGKWQHVGLTNSHRVTEFRVAVRGARQADGLYCVELDQVKMRVGFKDIKVFIDRRYRPGSCEFEAILDHENAHVNNFTSILAEYLPILRNHLNRVAVRMRPIKASNLDAGARIFQADIQRAMATHLRRLHEDVAKEDERIDTPESYRNNQARCSNW